MRLKGKNAVVTGAGSGIGRGTSLLFAREGATLLCVDVDAAFGRETVDLIRREGHAAEFIQADLSDAAAIQDMARQCMQRCAQIHVLFNNAAIFGSDNIETVQLEAWNRTLAVNLTAPCLCSAALLPALKAAGGASIIHNGSIDGVHGSAVALSYSVSKGGLVPLTHVMAHALARYGIRVNCINAGGIASSSEGIPIRLSETLRSGQGMPETMLRATPLGRAGSVEEFARAVLFLACDDSSYFTGSMLTMDGGRLAITPH
jgi:NAD(P)-dependent dehydrogenase (short-subunit alcohol dehydrogenase family)